MRSRALAIAVAVTALSILVLPSVHAADGMRIDAVDTSGHPEIVMTVTVPLDLAGAELAHDDVAVLEDGQRRPHGLARLAGDDLAVLLLIDTSGSMSGEPLDAAKAAAASFLEQLPSSARVAVMSFGDSPATATDFTTERATQLSAVDGLVSGGETALNDALVAAAASLPDGDDVHPAVVLLSDGGDTGSTATTDDAIRSLETAGATVHAIELRTAESDSAALQRLAKATNGTLTATTDPGALGQLYSAIASTLVNRYRVTYRSAASGPTQITVTVTADGTTITSSRELELPRSVTTAPAVPDPRSGTISAPGWVGDPWVFPAGTAAVFAALALILLPLLAPNERRSVLDGPSAGLADRLGQLPGLRKVADLLVGAADRRIGGERRRQVASRLERAGVPLRPGEAVVLTVLAMVTAGAVVTMLTGPWVGLTTAGLVAVAARTAVGVRVERRREAFRDQLADTLQVLAGSLRAGHGLLQSIDTVASEGAQPTAEEFRRVVVEVRLGRDLGDALTALADRIDVEDVQWMVQAMEIHRRVGGDLAEVLDTVGDTVRERAQVRGQVRALSAEGRLSAWILGLLPIVLVLLISLIRPEYYSEVLAAPLGKGLVIAGGVLLAAGVLWIRRLIQIDY